MSTRWATMLLLPLAGCLSADQPLLCASDEDCEADRRCELVSGLCVPALAPPSFAMGGISGAFECTLPTADGPGPRGRAPGIASVVVRPPDRDATCAGGPAGELAGLEAGCVVTREVLPRSRGMGEDPVFWVIRFEQTEGDPKSPEVRLALYVRVSAAAVGTLAAPVQVTAQYAERCTRNDVSELRLRFVSTQGSLQIRAIDEDRIEGTFDLDLAALEGGGDFGGACELPRPCEGGDCALVEQTTDRCRSGLCVPDPREPNPTSGFCSGECEDHVDCGFDREESPDAYCLSRPGQPFGRCIRLCDPAEATCPNGSSCRPGADFDEFPGGGGPARCLDECVATDSAPAPERCGGAVQPDGGLPTDGGRPDGGRPDSGPRDGGVPDSGPADTGPADAGGGSPLGTACSQAAPCPTGWFCAQAAAGPLGTAGHCSRACTGDMQCLMDYAGPGQATCRPAVRNLQGGMVVNPACMVLCGADFGQDGMCPHAMQCGDIIDNTSRMPPGDGRDDFCTE